MNTNQNWHGTTIVLIRKGKDTIVAVDSCGDAKKDMKIIKERLGHNL